VDSDLVAFVVQLADQRVSSSGFAPHSRASLGPL
jgi:hypothetical protein